MFSSIDSFLQESLSGLSIHSASAGFAEICLRPYFPPNVTEFSFWHQTDHGRIDIVWDRQEYRVTLPQGMAGSVCLDGNVYPLAVGENVIRRRTENGTV